MDSEISDFPKNLPLFIADIRFPSNSASRQIKEHIDTVRLGRNNSTGRIVLLVGRNSDRVCKDFGRGTHTGPGPSESQRIRLSDSISVVLAKPYHENRYLYTISVYYIKNVKSRIKYISSLPDIGPVDKEVLCYNLLGYRASRLDGSCSLPGVFHTLPLS